MNRRGMFALLLALISGAVIHIGDIYSPFALKHLSVEGGTRAVEGAVRLWSRDFARFWPKGLFIQGRLQDWAKKLPIEISLQWHPIDRSVEVNVTSARPKAKLLWNGDVFYLSAGGLLFSHELAARYTTVLPEGLPEIQLADDYPLKATTDDGIKQVSLDPDWILNLMDKMRTFPGLVATDLTLRRRGGEDLILCHLRRAEGGQSLVFQGSVPMLDTTLAVARRLLESGEAKGYGLLDATYSNKVFLRPAENDGVFSK